MVSVRTVSVGTLVYLFFLPYIAVAEGCTVSKIAIITGTDTAYTVQAQDTNGNACKVSETLQLSFETSGTGAFTSVSGAAVWLFISKGSANRNFNYHSIAGARDVLTVKAGYGDKDTWTVSWQTSYTVGGPIPSGNTGTPSDTSGTSTQKSAEGVVEKTNQLEQTSGLIAQPRLFAADSLKVVVAHVPRASVGQPVRFTATPSGLTQKELETLRYAWSFGDGEESTERMPEHVYTHPGTYVVMAVVARQRHEVVVRSEITVMPVAVTIERSVDGALVLHNDRSHEVEVSGMRLFDGRHTFMMPEYTYLLPNASIALPLSRTGFASGWTTATLADRSGATLAYYPTPTSSAALASQSVPSNATVPRPLPITSTSSAVSVSGVSVPTSTDGLVYGDQLAVARTSREPEVPIQTRTAYPMAASVAFAGVVILGIGALYVHKVV